MLEAPRGFQGGAVVSGGPDHGSLGVRDGLAHPHPTAPGSPWSRAGWHLQPGKDIYERNIIIRKI